MKDTNIKENGKLRVKRIFALILAVLLVCMYAATLVFAISCACGYRNINLHFGSVVLVRYA